MGAEENVRLWLAHLAGEFTNRNEEESLATMVEDATVCHVPTGSGGTGSSYIRERFRYAARLGLRGGEVLAMTLDDLDWERGTLLVRGKGRRLERLPLPKDVGAALIHYLRHVRPACASRKVFIRLKAPQRPLRSSGICCVVRRALKRAALNPDFKGAHLLRHSLATEMLRRGASLGEIGQLLRHQQPTTTQIYAKVDIQALRGIARPWMDASP